MTINKKYFHLEKVFSKRDVNGNVYSFLIITCNKNGSRLVCYDQGQNGSHFIRKFFDAWGKWTETERWEGIRDFNRELKFLETDGNRLYLREEEILAWLKKNHRIRKVKPKFIWEILKYVGAYTVWFFEDEEKTLIYNVTKREEGKTPIPPSGFSGYRDLKGLSQVKGFQV